MVLFLAVAAVIGVIVYNQLNDSKDQVAVPGGLTGGTCAQAKAKLGQVGLKGQCVNQNNDDRPP